MIDPVDQPFAAAQVAAEAVGRHDVAVVLGSGWQLPGDLRDAVAVPGLPSATVAGHRTEARSLSIGDRRVLVFEGRVHLYEGHHPNVVVHGVRTAVAAGCEVIVLTNAAGGVRRGLRRGQPVMISDHLNLTGRTPLLGANDDRLGPRFPDLTDAYSRRLRAIVHAVEPTLEEGVYAGFLGPAYETPAEVRMAATLGADLVGMSTVLETIAAVHAGAEVLALSLVTNPAAGLADEPLTHDDVLAAADEAAAEAGGLLARIVGRL